MRRIQKSQHTNREKTESSNGSHTNPIIRKKPSPRIYGGYNYSQRINNYQNTFEPLDVFKEFCATAKHTKNLETLFNYFHSLVVNKLNYNFTAFGFLNSSSNHIKVKLTDHIGNIYSSRFLLSDEKNPIIKSFLKKKKFCIDDFSFINVHYLNNSHGIIIPLVHSDECLGLIIAGASVKNPQNDDVLEVLSNFITLNIINKTLSEASTQDANIDSLTGLVNHGEFQAKLTEQIAKAKEENKAVSVIIFDINNISQMNKEYGHAKGDEIICILADRIKKNIRNIDIAGRYGGDELAIIMPEANNEEACYMAEYLNYIISCSLIDDVGPMKVNVGVSTYPSCAQEQEKLLLIAEQAMLISKSKSDKNGVASVVSAGDIDFWNEMALNSLATIIAKKHSQYGINFEEELVHQFHSENLSINNNNLDVVTSLAGAIDAKDPYTRGHSQAVSRYAEALARALNLPEQEVERIKLGAMLHDVGKIGIPESVLRKPGQLTDQEWDIMKQHPEIGVMKVLEPIHSLSDIIPIVRHHHEQLNGKGYPDGLKDDEIPYGARIVGIVDVFHALVSDRPYRKALPIEKAVEILKAGAGIQWDKDMVRKFIILAPSLITKT